jgi:shikimate dehydrogenase
MSNSSVILQPSSFQLGLIGFPLGHSLSPKIHTAALKACGLQGDYLLFSIHPDDKQGLKDLLDRVRAKEIHGLNVTIPHKQNVIPLVDELTHLASMTRAVNTIYLRDNKLIGDNTDAPGFLSDLKKHMGNQESGIRKSALVLGAGGSSRSVVYALLNDGWNVTLAARRLEQAQLFTRFFTHLPLNLMEYSSIPQSLHSSSFSLLVNTTPLGMLPNIDQSPLPEDVILSPDIMIYDLVYNPRETKLVKDARAQGCSAFTGLGMLIEQAALAFEIWTGNTPPRNTLYDSVVE